jgi:hypothetical protein
MRLRSVGKRWRRWAAGSLLVLPLVVFVTLSLSSSRTARYDFLRHATLVQDAELGAAKGMVGTKVKVFELEADWDELLRTAQAELTNRGWTRISSQPNFALYVPKGTVLVSTGSIAKGPVLAAGTDFIQIARGRFDGGAVHSSGIASNRFATVRFMTPARPMALSESFLAYLFPPKTISTFHTANVLTVPCQNCHRSSVVLPKVP